MNLLILGQAEIGTLLPPGDRRVLHIVRVLGKKKGELVEAGLLVDEAFGPAPGSLGKARIESLDEGGMILSFFPEAEAPPLLPLRLILGFPRPIQGTRLLRDLASLGVADLVLTGTELGEKSYLESDLWKKGDYRGAILEGAEQAANPRLPRVRRAWTPRRALEELASEETSPAHPDWAGGEKICLHPGPGRPRLGSLSYSAPVSLAIGSERGWTDAEVALLSGAGYEVASLGDRILKTETAALAATSIVLARLGLV